MGEFVTGCLCHVLAINQILFLIFEGCNCAQLSTFVNFHGPEATPQRGFDSLWNGFIVVGNKTRLMGEFVTSCVMFSQFIKFCSGFSKGVTVPNCQHLYLFMDLKQHSKGALTHFGMVLLWWEIKQG